MANAGDVAQERLRRRLRGGGEREEEGRDADGDGRGQRELARQEREGAAADADGQDERRGEHGLRDEQLGHALDVAQDLAAPPRSAKGIDSKLSLTSTTSATPLASWLPEPERDRDVALLECRDVVDAVSDHPDAPTAATQRRDQLALVLGLHAGEDGVVDRAAAQRARPPPVARHPVVTRPSVSMPGGARDGRHRRRPVARDDLDVDARAVQVGDGRGRVGAHALAQRDQRERHERGQARLVVALGLGQAVARARTAARAGGCSWRTRDLVRRGRGRLARSDHLGRSQHELGAVAERDAAPLPARGERHLERDGPRRPAELGVQRVRGRVAAAEARGERAEQRVHLAPRRRPRDGTISSTASVPSVSVPVLSRQTTSSPASASTAGRRCTSAPRRPTRAAATANTRLASSTSPSGTSETMPATAVETASRVGTSCTCSAYSSSAEIGIISADHQAQQPVDRELQRRELAAILARDARELVGVRVGADALGLVDAAAGHAEGARLHRRRPRAARPGRTRR